MKKWLIGALFPLGILTGIIGWRTWDGSASGGPVLGIGLIVLGAALAVSSLFLLPKLFR